MPVLLVPIKAFRDAKLRLTSVLDPEKRRSLAMTLARGVILAGREMAVFVVCDDHEVASFAESLGAVVIWTPGRGLSGAVEAGVDHLCHEGVDTVVVAHADLPRADGFGHIAEGAGSHNVTIVPDRSFNGTNVIALPAGAEFRFSYGPGSFARHCAEAQHLGLELTVLADDALSVDIDLPADLALVAEPPG